jgi:hypothetical protein
VIWTYYGPRRICRYRPWLANYYWRDPWPRFGVAIRYW